MNPGEPGDQTCLYENKTHTAEHRAPHRADATDDRHEKDEDTHVEGKYILRINDRRAMSVDASGDTGEGRADGVYPQLGAVGIDAEVGGRVLILADGPQLQPNPAVGDDHGNVHGQPAQPPSR